MNTRPIVTEEPPYRRTNSDGRINAGSYEVNGVLSVVALAHRLILEDRPGEPSPPEVSELRPLARYLISAVDTVQQRSAGRIDRMAASSARAMAAVRCALYAYPVPWHTDSAAKQEWWHQIVDHASSVYDLALELVAEPDQRAAAS